MFRCIENIKQLEQSSFTYKQISSYMPEGKSTKGLKFIMSFQFV